MKTDLKVPQGYFEQLDKRLCEIPAQSKVRKLNLTPYLSLAASFIAIAVIGNYALHKTVPASLEDGVIGYEDWYYADLLPVTAPYFYIEEEDEYNEADDAYDWAIATRLPAEYLELLDNNE